MTGIVAFLDRNPVVGPQKHGPRRFWTNREIALLDANWSSGIATCLPLLPGRTASAIYGKALTRGLASPETLRRGLPRCRHTTTEFIDAAIRRAYQDRPTRGSIRRLAHAVIRPGWWVRKRATELGCAIPRFKQLPWTEDERQILEANATRKCEAIARVLKRHGYSRSATAVAVMLKRLHIDRTDPERMSARALGDLLGVDSKTVTRLIAAGLPAERVSAIAGSEYRIARRKFRRFVIENPTAIDIRKVDQVWFIDLLGSAA